MIGITNVVNKKASEVERINISLQTNQSSHADVSGVNFTVTYGNYTKSYTWGGNAVTVEIPAYVSYTISFGNMAGYKKPSDVTYAAQAGNSRTLNAIYQTCVLSVNIADNQSSLNDISSIKATVKGTSVNTTLSSGGSVKVPFGEAVTITGPALSGYATPSAQSYTAADANKTITLTYNTTLVTVAMADNQTAYNDIANATATVAASGITTQTVSNGGVVKVPTGVSCTVTWKGVTNYKTPTAQTFTTSGSAVTKTGTYQTEVVTVSLSADNGVSVVGQKVTINGTTHTWNGTAITQKIAFGTSYSISVDAKSGYTTPSAQSFTASQSGRNCNLVYNFMPGVLNPSPGVYIQDTEGYCFKKEDWNSNLGRTPNGIAVVSSANSFVVALNYVSSARISEDSEKNPGLSAKPTVTQASSDFNGKSNTQSLINVYGSSNTIQGNCSNYTFPNGKKGYMPAAGQAQLIGLNITEINDCRIKATGQTTSFVQSVYSSTYQEYYDDGTYKMARFWVFRNPTTDDEFWWYVPSQNISRFYPITDF